MSGDGKLPNPLDATSSLLALLEDDDVTDVMVVAGRGAWVECGGEMLRLDFDLNAEQVERIVERVVAPLGLRIDRSSPMVDARMSDGSRLNAVIPPIALDGPCLSIRRFTRRNISIDNFTNSDTRNILLQAVTNQDNIIVSGATGTGKTTFLSALLRHIDPQERVVTIEDTAELNLAHSHVVRMESRVANSEGAGEITARQLVRNALRMRPDRIVIGEVRGPEALDMLQAMNTGHRGCITTCHANSCHDVISRLETMVMTANVGLPSAVIRRQIGSAVDLVIHLARDQAGVRRVEQIAEVKFDEVAGALVEVIA